nr:zinc finger, CCHC-type, retrotransposon Gag domain protein [Tanacetum cinerariifolium]
MKKIFDVVGCEDAFKTRLAVYKFEGDVLAWWKAYKQAKGGDVWLSTVTNEKVVVAKEKLKEACTRQKSYADKHRRSIEFQPGDH